MSRAVTTLFFCMLVVALLAAGASLAQAATKQCSQPNRPAHIVREALGDTPQSPVEEPSPRPIEVGVNVSSSGAVTAVWIVKSSGDAAVDHGAVRIARESLYAPAMRKCKPVAGTVLVNVIQDR